MNTDRPLHSRRQFLLNTLAACACIACENRPAAGATPSRPGAQQHRRDREFLRDGRERRQGDRRAGRQDRGGMAEAPVAGFLSHYAAIGHGAVPSPASTTRNTAPGLYRCICCDTALFDSKTKFDSGTGWPSFWKTISRSNAVEGPGDRFGMLGAAISCARCDAHLGHVFSDGPKADGFALLHELRGAQLRSTRWLT